MVVWVEIEYLSADPTLQRTQQALESATAPNRSHSRARRARQLSTVYHGQSFFHQPTFADLVVNCGGGSGSSAGQ
jgi:hypothetical protein